MAASTILLRRPSACLLGGASQFYCRYLSPCRIIDSSSMFSARQFCSSSPSKSNEPVVKDYMKQRAVFQQALGVIEEEINSLRKEIASLREEREGLKEPPIQEVAVVKEKHPLLLNIELEVSKSDELNHETKKPQLPHGFEVENDKPGAALVTLKGKHKDEIINIELSIPACYVMLLNVKVTLTGRFSGFFKSTEAVFQCTFRNNGFEVEKIKEPNGSDHGIHFYNLPENLKDEFHKYLKIRGVHEENAIMLYKYMVGRTNRENLRALESFKKMVDAAA